MISIVVCSINKNLFQDLSTNINKTIGNSVFEIIPIDNKKEKLSIARAYNKGLELAKFNIVLFIHEDILFHTSNWGKILLAFFKKDNSIGLVGVAGSKIKTKFPSGWWENDPALLNKFILQHYPNGKKNLMKAGFNSSNLEEMVVIDGVFMAMRKIPKIRFDERLTGFHFYDQGISLRIRNAGYRVMVNNKILIEHFSYGNKDVNWLKSSIKFQKLYSEHLPQTLVGNKVLKKQKRISCKFFLENCRRLNLRIVGLPYWLRYLYLSNYSVENRRWFNYFFKIK
jgi:GT2 family glycosyltransferase